MLLLGYLCMSAVYEAPSLTPAASCFSYPHVPFFQNRRQNSLSGKNTHLFSKSENIETTLTHWLSKRPWMWLLGRTLSSLMTFRLHFYVSGQNMGRNNARFTTYHFKICQRRDKLIFVTIFIWRNEVASSCSCNLDRPSASRSLFQTEQGEDMKTLQCSNANVQLRG